MANSKTTRTAPSAQQTSRSTKTERARARPNTRRQSAPKASRQAPLISAELRVEIYGLVIIAFSLMLLLAIASYDPAQAKEMAELAAGGANWIGPVGTRLGSFALGAVGIFAFPLDLLLLAFGITVLLGSPLRLGARWSWGGLGAMLSAMVLIHLAADGGRVLGHHPSGWLGAYAAEACRTLLSTVGTALVATTALAISLVWLTSIPASRVLGPIFRPVISAFGAVRDVLLDLWDDIRDSLQREETAPPVRLSGRLAARKDAGPIIGQAPTLPSEPRKGVPKSIEGSEPQDNPPLTTSRRAAKAAVTVEDDDDLQEPEAGPTISHHGALDPAWTQSPLPAAPAQLPGPSVIANKSSAAVTRRPHTSRSGAEEEVPAKPASQLTAEEEMSVEDLDDDEFAEIEREVTELDSRTAAEGAVRVAPGPRNAAAAGPKIVESEAMRSRAQLSLTLPEAQRRAGSSPDVAWHLPSLDFLDYEPPAREAISADLLKENAAVLEQKLLDFGVKGKVVEIHPGPVITMYEFKPAPGVKISKIANLADDLSMALASMRVRIVAPIPGKSVVGIEVPNKTRETVYLKEVMADDAFQKSKSMLTLALGKDIVGYPSVTDLAKAPHLLVAGSTGSGKSVALNSFIVSILYKATPDEVRVIMVDPKMLELSVYEGIPHLLLPVVTDPKKAAQALKWAVSEMERRYKLLAEAGVRNIGGYNVQIEELRAEADAAARAPRGIVLDDDSGGPTPAPEPPPEKLPYIVVIIDELADLMMVASKDVETSIARLAQMARAAGIHLILATQRPSVDVITGLIKANFPTRVSFQVSSKIDSRTILDRQGAENLLGMGDMLFMPPGTSKLQRIHGTYIGEKEIARITNALKKQGRPQYCMEILESDEDGAAQPEEQREYDEFYDQAVAIVAETRNASISYLQRRLKIGYNRAARIVEMMELEGIIGAQNGPGPREVFVDPA